MEWSMTNDEYRPHSHLDMYPFVSNAVDKNFEKELMMSTHSFICEETDGKICAIYCHFDGYPDGVGTTLKEHYQCRNKLERLLSNGDISGLEETPEKCRGLEDTEARYFDSKNDLIQEANDLCIEFVYLFTKTNEWIWLEIYDDNRHWQKL